MACSGSSSEQDPNGRDATAAGDDAGASDAASAGRDGSSQSDGAVDDAAAIDGAVAIPPGLSARAACRAYVQAWCARIERCRYSGSGASCNQYISACPDVLLSPGSTRTPEGLYLCAQQWSTMSCEQVLGNESPDCATPGGRALGEACIYASQCASGACTGNRAACGQCATPLPEGETCTRDTQGCAPGLECESQVCTVVGEVTPTGRAAPGEECWPNGGGCVDFYDCGDDASSSTGFRCVELPLGSECYREECPESSYCAAQSNVCTALPQIGEPCADIAGVISPYRLCVPEGYCGDGDACQPRLPLGAQCTSGQCLEALECAERRSTGYGNCLVFHEEDESCAGEFERCVDGTTCQGGVCTAVESLGLFEAVCGS